jgi:hypothetical protein
MTRVNCPGPRTVRTSSPQSVTPADNATRQPRRPTDMADAEWVNPRLDGEWRTRTVPTVWPIWRRNGCPAMRFRSARYHCAGPPGCVGVRANSAGVRPYWLLKARMKWLLSAKCQRAASSATLGPRPAGVRSSRRACSSLRRRMYPATLSSTAANARCSVRIEQSKQTGNDPISDVHDSLPRVGCRCPVVTRSTKKGTGTCVSGYGISAFRGRSALGRHGSGTGSQAALPSRPSGEVGGGLSGVAVHCLDARLWGQRLAAGHHVL